VREHSLLAPKPLLMKLLTRHMSLELAVGTNGLVWVHAERTVDTVIAVNALRIFEHMHDEELAPAVNRLVSKARSAAGGGS
jgi:exosome complex RNA-binding protein Rrp4